MNRTFITTTIVVIALLASSCNRQSGEQGLSLHQITSNQAKPTTLFLSITEKTEQDTAILYQVQGLFNQDTVGFLVSLDRDIPAGINDDGSVNESDGFKTGTVKFLSSGEQSDAFVAALADLWGQSLEAGTFSSEAVVPLAFSSNKNPVDHQTPSTNNFKLFFQPDLDEPGELFFTLDTYRRSIEFQEKDEKFRATILEALTSSQD